MKRKRKIDPCLCDKNDRAINRDGTWVCRECGRCFGTYIPSDPFNPRRAAIVPIGGARKNAGAAKYYNGANAIAAKVLGVEELNVSFNDPIRTNADPGHVLNAGGGSTLDLLAFQVVCNTITKLLVSFPTIRKDERDAIVVGALFLMRFGVNYTNCQVDKNEFVAKRLPKITALPSLGFERNVVRIGKNLIERYGRASKNCLRASP